MKLTMEEQIKELSSALETAQQEADKWQTGAEIYEAQASELQETVQVMTEEIEKLRRENDALHQNGNQPQTLTPQNDQQTTMMQQEIMRYKIIEDALIDKIQYLEQELNKQNN